MIVQQLVVMMVLSQEGMSARPSPPPSFLPSGEVIFGGGGFWGFLAALRGMQDLSSLTRDRTCAPAVEVQSLNHWTTREVPR